MALRLLGALRVRPVWLPLAGRRRPSEEIEAMSSGGSEACGPARAVSSVCVRTLRSLLRTA
eukprot:7872991-Pyramimonas_sp.AAC.1